MQDTYKLTAHQRELAMKNHNLIYRFAKVNKVDLEEFYGILAIGLCKAAAIYKESAGYTFSTLAYKCMNNEYKAYWRKELAAKRIPHNMIISYNNVLSNISEPKNEYIDIIHNGINTYNIDHSRVEVSEFMHSLGYMQRLVVYGLMCGYSESEIAHITGYSRTYINNVKKRVRKKVGQV